MNAGRQLRGQVQIPGPVAAWVLFTHCYSLLIPVYLAWVVYSHLEFIASRSDFPFLFFVAVALMSAGAAFEIAQNHIDGWYLESGQGSTGDKGFCAFIFVWLVLANQAMVAIACTGSTWWMSAIMLTLLAVFPYLYLSDRPPLLPFALGGVAATVVVFLSFGTPLIFLSFLLTWLTGYFFGLLKVTRAQSLHGFATLVASSQGLLLALSIQDAADGVITMGWIPVAVTCACVAGLALGFKGNLASLSPTPRDP